MALSAGTANAQTVASCSNASDSPLGAATICGSVCTLLAGSTALVCDFSSCGGPVEWTILSNFANGFEEVAFGNCNGTDRCCTLDDNASQVTEFWTIGSAYSDTLLYSTPAGLTLTLNGATSRQGVILGGDGGDFIGGSQETSSSYEEGLYGEGGSDHIKGTQGDDVASGGSGHDIVHGNAGDDCLWGGSGYDEMYGGGGGEGAVRSLIMRGGPLAAG